MGPRDCWHYAVTYPILCTALSWWSLEEQQYHWEQCPLHSLQEAKGLEFIIRVQRALLAQTSLASLCCPSQSPCWWAVCSRESSWCQQPAQVVGTIATSSSEQMGSKLKPWWGDHPESWLLWCGFQTNGNMFQSGLAIGCNHGVEIC